MLEVNTCFRQSRRATWREPRYMLRTQSGRRTRLWIIGEWVLVLTPLQHAFRLPSLPNRYHTMLKMFMSRRLNWKSVSWTINVQPNSRLHGIGTVCVIDVFLCNLVGWWCNGQDVDLQSRGHGFYSHLGSYFWWVTVCKEVKNFSITNTKVNSAFYLYGVGKSSTGLLGWG